MEKGAYVWKRSGGRYNSTTLEFEFEFETFLQHGGCAMVLYCVAKSGAGAFIPSTTFEPLHCCDRQKQPKL